MKSHLSYKRSRLKQTTYFHNNLLAKTLVPSLFFVVSLSSQQYGNKVPSD